MRHRTAFTLVEMLAALMIAAMLLVGTLMVVRSLAQHMPRKLSDQREITPDSGVLQRLSDLLRRDLQHAQGMRFNRGQLRLIGYGAIDAASQMPSFRPARVVYAIEDIGGVAWLTRRQSDLDVLSNLNTRRTLVCAGLGGFELREPDARPDQNDPTLEVRPVTTPAATTSGDPLASLMQRESLTELPKRVELVLYGPDGETSLFKRQMVVRD